jgi:hypothetical protein
MGFEADATRKVANHYGPRDVDTKYPGAVTNRAGVSTLTLTFDYNDLPSASFPDIQAQIPKGATIVAARFDVLTAFTSTSTTTDLQVGIADADGGSTLTDVDAIFTAANLTQTVIGAAGITSGSGASVGGTAMAEAVCITVTPNVDDLTAGRGRIEVDYKVYAGSYTAPTGT